MLSAIAGARATDRIKPWFNDKSAFKSDGDQNRWTLINDVSKVLGLDGVGLPPDLVNLEAQLPIDKSWTRKARFIGPVFVYAQGNSNQTSKSNFGALVKDGNLKISLDGQDFFIGLNKLLDEIKAGVNSDPTQQAMVLVDIDPHLSLIVKSAFGKVGTVASLNSMQFWIVQHE